MAALDIAGRLDLVDADLLCWWCVHTRVARLVGPASLLACVCYPTQLVVFTSRRGVDCAVPDFLLAGCASGRPRVAASTVVQKSCRMCATPGGACLRCPSWEGCTGLTSKLLPTSSWSVRHEECSFGRMRCTCGCDIGKCTELHPQTCYLLSLLLSCGVAKLWSMACVIAVAG